MRLAVANSDMEVADQIRRIYEKRPYPLVRRTPEATRTWQLAPLSWIMAIAQPSQETPRRILVAGCGTGVEAFRLRQVFPKSDITAVDFSPRSIRVARKLQSSIRDARPIRFAVGDLTSRNFARAVNTDFDLVTCHGVLSYIPNLAAALRNLARCLAADGALYLGVNGASHFNRAFRPVLAAFGHDPKQFSDSPALRRLLRLCDLVAGNPPGSVAQKDAAFLGGDLFGALNRALPLARWNRLAQQAGLHCCGSLVALVTIRPALDEIAQFMPRSRGEVAELLDWLNPASFHRLIFKRNPNPTPSWRTVESLLDWSPQRTGLYTQRFPKQDMGRRGLVRFEMRSHRTNALVEMQLPGWELEILRRSEGMLPLREILDGLAVRPPARQLLASLYRHYQFAVLNFLPPAGN